MPIDFDRIEARREELGLSQDVAAKRAKMKGRQQWNNIVKNGKSTGGKKVSVVTLERIAAALEIDMSDLLKRPRAKAGK